MRLEVLVSTMHQKDLSLVNGMNIKTEAVIINQCDKEDIRELIINEKKIRMLSYKERGLSKSRNRAIANSQADVCVIADDDLVYRDDYENTILKAYEKYPDVDVIAFNVPCTNPSRPTSILKEGNVDFLHSMKISSFQISFKRKSLVENGIKFNENFGAGAKYTCGEENILLTNCLQKGLKIKYVKEDIAIVHHNESTWFSGFNERYFKTKGAMFYEMNPILAYLLITQFAVRKFRLYKREINPVNAYRAMINGIFEYKKLKALN